LLRITDNLITRVVGFYDGLFDLEREEEGQLYIELGRQLIADGRPDDALQLFRKATVVQPEDPAGWIELGTHYLQRKAPKAAIGALEKALEVGVESAKVHRCLAQALQELGDLAEAEAELERGLTLDAESAECWFELGIVRDARADFERAVEAFAKAVELAPHRMSHHQRLGFALESAGRRKDAIESFKIALKLESETERGR
jgi:tetratricopeptide (TPR) repeat protein